MANNLGEPTIGLPGEQNTMPPQEKEEPAVAPVVSEVPAAIEEPTPVVTDSNIPVPEDVEAVEGVGESIQRGITEQEREQELADAISFSERVDTGEFDRISAVQGAPQMPHFDETYKASVLDIKAKYDIIQQIKDAETSWQQSGQTIPEDVQKQIDDTKALVYGDASPFVNLATGQIDIITALKARVDPEALKAVGVSDATINQSLAYINIQEKYDGDIIKALNSGDVDLVKALYGDEETARLRQELTQLGAESIDIRLSDAKKVTRSGGRQVSEIEDYIEGSGYNIARYLRDNDNSESAKQYLSSLGFQEEAINEAIDYNNLPWNRLTAQDRFNIEFVKAGGDLTGMQSPEELDRILKNNPELLEIATQEAKLKGVKPDVSVTTFVEYFVAARENLPAYQSIKNKEARIQALKNMAVREYIRLYGKGTALASQGTDILTFIAPAARALQPEYDAKDIKATEWAITAANIALLAVSPIIGKIATKTASALAGGASKALQTAAVLTYPVTTAVEAKNMSVGELVFAIAIDTVLTAAILGKPIANTIKNLNPGLGLTKNIDNLAKAVRTRNITKIWQAADKLEKYGEALERAGIKDGIKLKNYGTYVKQNAKVIADNYGVTTRQMKADWTKGSVGAGYGNSSNVELVNLVDKGDKPLSIIYSQDADIEIAIKTAKEKGLVVEKATGYADMPNAYYVYRNNKIGQQAKNTLSRLGSADSWATRAQEIQNHIKIGKALGYTDNDIAAYLRRATTPSAEYTIDGVPIGELKIRWSIGDIAKYAPEWYRAVTGRALPKQSVSLFDDLLRELKGIDNSFALMRQKGSWRIDGRTGKIIDEAGREMTPERQMEELRQKQTRRLTLAERLTAEERAFLKKEYGLTDAEIDNLESLFSGDVKAIRERAAKMARDKKLQKMFDDIYKDIELQEERKLTQVEEDLLIEQRAAEEAAVRAGALPAETYISVEEQEAIQQAWRTYIEELEAASRLSKMMAIYESLFPKRKLSERDAELLNETYNEMVAAVSVTPTKEVTTTIPAISPIKIPLPDIKTTPLVVPTTITSPLVETDTKILAKPVTKTVVKPESLTETKLMTSVQPITDTKTELAVETALKQATLPDTKLMVKTGTLVVEPPPVEPFEPPPIKPPKEPDKDWRLKLRLDSGSGDRVRKLPSGSITWAQGQLKGGNVWKYIPPPYRQSKPVTLMQAPIGARNAGSITPKDTIQIIGSAKNVPKRVHVDLGWTDIEIINGKTIKFLSGGEKTNVGTNDPSTTTGMATLDAGDFADLDIVQSKDKVKSIRHPKKKKKLNSYEYMTTLKGFRP